MVSYLWELPGSPVVRTQHFHCLGLGSISGRGTKIPQALQHGKKKKTKNTKSILSNLVETGGEFTSLTSSNTLRFLDELQPKQILVVLPLD